MREVQHTLERAVILGDSNLLRPNDFLFPTAATGSEEEETQELNLEKLERKAIEQALRTSNGHSSRASELLGITRFALYRKMEKLDL